MLNYIDFIVIGLYIASLLVVGFWYSRSKEKEGFLLADRKLTLLDSVSTIVASKIGAGFLIAYLAFVYLWGWSAIWFFIGYAAGFLFFIPFAKLIKTKADEGGFYTLADYFFSKYGKVVGYSMAAVFFIRFFFQTCVQLLGGAKVLEAIAPISYAYALVLIAGVITIYLVIGGFKSVVKTDVIQFVSICILFSVIAVFLVVNKVDSNVILQFENLSTFDIVGFFIFGLLFPFASAELWQRVYAAKDQRILLKSLVFSSAIFLVVGFIITYIALAISASIANIQPELILTRGFAELLPSGLAGLGIVALFAAVMSSADTQSYTTASFLVQNLTKNIFRDPVKAMKISLLAIMITASTLAFYYQNIIQWEFVSTAVMLTLGLIILISWFYSALSKLAIMFGMLGGLGMTVYKLVVFSQLQPDDAAAILFAVLIAMLIGQTSRYLYNKVFQIKNPV